MIRPDGQPILNAAQIRAAEDAVIATGTSVEALMRRAGEGIAAAVRRLGARAEVLIVCGPGNNGGDGYVAAQALQRNGIPVRICAEGEPRTDAARFARSAWTGPVAMLDTARPAPILLDCLFGTGLSRPLPAETDAALARLAKAATLLIAADLPSGIDADTGAVPAWIEERPATLTLALGALKPAHVLEPAASACGTTRLIDLGLSAQPHAVRHAANPDLPHPGPDAHKYTRGMIAIVVGAMEGAARLAGIAALRSGAGYVALYGGSGHGGPDALVHRPYDAEALSDRRIGAILIGPGLGRTDEGRGRLEALTAADTHALVIDGDALHLLDPDALANRRRPVILTPHAGEFRALFGDLPGSLIDQAQAASRRSGAIVVLKGPTTVVASPNDTIVHPHGNPWLSTAGTGDVLAGTIAAQIAYAGTDPLAAASAGVWLHARAARRLGASFIADDLANALTPVRAEA